MAASNFQLSVFGLVLHLLNVERDLLEKCLLPGWEVTSLDRHPDITIQVHYDPISHQPWVQVGRAATALLAPEELKDHLDQCIHMQIAEHCTEAVFIHAGVVAWQGTAILIPGRSMAGKSTLTRALVEAGCTYYSDEFAPLLPDGRILPYPKPLNQRRVSQPTRQIPAQDLGWHPALPPIPLGLVLSVRYSAEPDTRGVAELSKAQATIALLENTVCAQIAPERSLLSASFAVRAARCQGGARGDAGDFARALLSGELNLATQPL